MIKTKKPELKQLYPLSHMVSTMYDKRIFCVLSLRRKFSKKLFITHSKTRQHFRIVNKATGNYCSCTYEYCLDGTVRIDVVFTSKFKKHRTYHFSVSTNRELMQKLLQYNLID